MTRNTVLLALGTSLHSLKAHCISAHTTHTCPSIGYLEYSQICVLTLDCAYLFFYMQASYAAISYARYGICSGIVRGARTVRQNDLGD